MSEFEKKLPNVESAKAKRLHRRLQQAGDRLAQASVSIKELDPNWESERDSDVSQSSFVLRPTVVGWSSAILVVAVICLFTLNYSGQSSSDPNETTRNGSSSIADNDRIAIPQNGVLSSKSNLAQTVASALAKKHRISLAPRIFAAQEKTVDELPGEFAIASFSLNSIVRKRRISLNGLSESINELDDFSLPEIRFRLVPTQR